MTRREHLSCLAGLAAGGSRAALPAPVAAIIQNTLKRDPSSLNTDWFGTLLVKGLLEWGRRGVPEALEYSRRWFDHHLKSGRVAKFSGIRGRDVNAGGILVTTYCGHFGLSFPCYELARQFSDARARRVCLEMADIILHRTARNRLGLVGHDDTSEFAIPDTVYFVVVALMVAWALEPSRGGPWLEQAVYQARTAADLFLMRDTGLAKTILLKSGLGNTYWTRASGWLLWAITGLLRHLPESDPRRAGFIADLEKLAGGMRRAQDSSGALHVFLDDPSSPAETSGTAMFAMGVHEAMRKKWLPESFAGAVRQAWSFVEGNITPEGNIRNVYTGWAVPAENRRIEMDKVFMGWIPGFVLSAANEMTT